MKDLLDFPDQCEEAYSLGKIKIDEDITKIVVISLGAGQMAGEALKSYLDDIHSKIPVFLCTDYSLPDYVDSKTLVFVLSFSGNTEETIASYRKALRQSAKIVIITTGGKLGELGLRNKDYVVKIPDDAPVIFSLGYMIFPMINVIRYSRIWDPGILKSDLVKTMGVLRRGSLKETGKRFAQRIGDKNLIVYSSRRLSCISKAWKYVLSKISKTFVHSASIPEANHSEIESFERLKGFAAIFFKDEDDYHKIKHRIDITKKMASNYCDVMEVKLTGTNTLSKIITAVYLSYFVAYFIAKNKKIDPTKTPNIDMFKKALRSNLI